MSSANQSTVSSKAFPFQASDAGMSLSSQQRRRRMAVKIAAWVEIIVGASFLIVISAQSQLIFAATPEGIGALWGRFSGIALIGLGLACLPSNSAGTDRSAVRGLLVFNIAVTIFFAWVALATTFRGVLLWPVVILHAVIAIALIPSLRSEDSRTV
jgi:hypothetical protein